MPGITDPALPTSIAALIAQFGTPPDYTEFEADGTMVARGDATTWRDELQPLIGSRLESPASDIQINIPEGSVTFEASARYPTDYAVVVLQINHDWELGSNVHVHIHWWQVIVEVANWLIATRWQKQGGAKTTAWTNSIISANAYAWTAGTLNQITEFTPIVPPVGYGEVSDILQIRLFRDVTNVSGLFAGAEAAPADIDVVNLDAHIKTDTLGSREEYVK